MNEKIHENIEIIRKRCDHSSYSITFKVLSIEFRIPSRKTSSHRRKFSMLRRQYVVNVLIAIFLFDGM